MNRLEKYWLQKNSNRPRRVTVRTMSRLVNCSHHPKGEHWISAGASFDGVLLWIRGACDGAAGRSAQALGAKMDCVVYRDTTIAISQGNPTTEIPYNVRYDNFCCIAGNGSNRTSVASRLAERQNFKTPPTLEERFYNKRIACATGMVLYSVNALTIYATKTENGVFDHCVAYRTEKNGMWQPHEFALESLNQSKITKERKRPLDCRICGKSWANISIKRHIDLPRHRQKAHKIIERLLLELNHK